MSRSSAQRKQEKDIKTFMDFTGADKITAQKYLSDHSWKLDQATNIYFNQPPPQKLVASSDQIDKIFNKYSNKESVIDADGVMKLFADLSMNVNDIETLIFAWICGAQEYAKFSKQEFHKGLKSLHIDSFKTLEKVCPTLKQFVTSEAQFQDFYYWAFDYCKDFTTRSIKPDAMSLESSKQLWTLLFNGSYPHLKDFLMFLDEKKEIVDKERRERDEKRCIPGKKKVPFQSSFCITMDTWKLFLEFVRRFRQNDFTTYSDKDAWPTLFDEYVEWTRKDSNGNPSQPSSQNMDYS